MPEKLAAFLRDVKSAKVKGEAADAEVIAKLKKMTAEEFARVPRDVLSNLSATQYAEIVRTVAPEVNLKSPEKTTPVGQRHTRAWSAYWAWIPAPVAAVMISIFSGMVILAAAISATPMLEWQSYSKALSRPAVVAEWPRCPRLSRWTDGCVYQVTSGLSWRDAATYLDIPESYLRHLNRHIPGDSIPAGSDLTVWRDRFPLQETR